MAVSRGDYGSLDEFLTALGNDPSYQAAQASESTWTPQRNEQYETLERSVIQGGPGSMGKNVVIQEQPNPYYSEGVPGGSQTFIDAEDKVNNLLYNLSQQDTYAPEVKGSQDWLVLTDEQGVVSGNLGASFAPQEGELLDPIRWQQQQMAEQQQEDFSYFTKGIDDQIAAINAEVDPDKRELKLIELKSSYEEMAAKKMRKIKEDVLAKYNVPQLEQALARSMALDASMDPSITKGKSSVETLQLASQMKVAEAGVKRDLQLALKENPELEGSEAKVNNFLKYSEAKIKQERIAAEKERVKAEKDEAKKEQDARSQAQKDEIEIAKAGSRGIEIAKLLDPTIATDDAKAATYFNARRAGDKEIAALAESIDNPAALKLLASDPTRVRSATVLAHVNAKEKAGDNQSLYAVEFEKSKKEIQQYQGMINTPEGIKYAEKVLYPDIDAPEEARSEKTKQYVSQKTLAIAEAGTAAEKQKVAQQYAISNATAAMDKTAEMRFTSNIEGWDPATVQNMKASPILSKVFQSVRGSVPTGPISMQVMAGAIAAIPDMADRQRAKQEFQRFADQAVTYHDKGVLGKAGGTLLTQTIINGAIFDTVKPKSTPWSVTSETIRGGLGAARGFVNNRLVQPSLAAVELPISFIDVALNTPVDEYSEKSYIDRVLGNAFERASTIIARSQE